MKLDGPVHVREPRAMKEAQDLVGSAWEVAVVDLRNSGATTTRQWEDRISDEVLNRI